MTEDPTRSSRDHAADDAAQAPSSLDGACRAVEALLADPWLDLADSVPDPVAEHLRGCAACRAARGGYARLDALLAAEPAPPAPADLVGSVLARVARRRAHDQVWARQQALVLVAAAVAVAAGLALTPADAPGGAAAGEFVRAGLAALATLTAGLGALGDAAGGLLPSPSLLLLAALAPALLLLDGLACRRGLIVDGLAGRRGPGRGGP